MLQLSKDSALTDIFSIGDGSNPLTTDHPVSGSSVEMQVFLFNDDGTKRYEGVSIDPTDATGTDESSWFQLAPDVSGNAGTYLSGSEPLSMSDVSDSGVAYPLWVKVTTPDISDTQNKTDINLKIGYTEYAV